MDDAVNTTRVPQTSGSPLVAIDLFCGAGGMTQGLRESGLDVRVGVDNDPNVQATYEANHSPDSTFLCTDVTTLGEEQLRPHLHDVDTRQQLVLVGCSPCQFWSQVNTSRENSRASSKLLLHVGQLAEELEPWAIVVENVPGLLRKGAEEVLNPFLEKITSIGFESHAYGIVRATSYGVAQSRERFLLIATRSGGPASLPPIMNGPAPTLHDVIGTHNGFERLEAGQASASDPLHSAAALSTDNLARIRCTPHDGGTRFAWADTPLQIPAYQGKDNHFRNVYGRAWWDRPGPTLTTRFNSLSNGRFGHPEEDRALSIREGAAIQSFPPSYSFVGNQRQVCKQIGNAVPPKLASAVGSHLWVLRDSSSAFSNAAK